MTSQPARSFVLRLWLERGDREETEGEWRGEVKPVPAGDSAYFRTLEALPALLARLLGREPRSER
jgi:hypothetical protein